MFEEVNMENFPGVKKEHTLTFLNMLVDKGWVEIHTPTLNKVFKSSVTRTYCLNKLKELNIIEVIGGSKVAKRANKYRIAKPSNIPTIEEKEFLAGGGPLNMLFKQEDVKWSGLHYKYKNQVPEEIIVTKQDVVKFKEIKDWVIENYFGFDAGVQMDKCIESGMKELVADWLIKKYIEKEQLNEMK